MKDVIRVGLVSSINYEKGFVQVTYPDRENAVTGELPYFSHHYEMPKVGEKVVVLYLTNGNHEGFVLGGYYHPENLPVKTGEGLIHKPLGEKSAVEYQIQSDTAALTAGSIQFSGENTIALQGGTVSIAGGNASMKTDGETMEIQAKNIRITGENIIIETEEHIVLQGKSITLRGETETEVIG